MTHSRHKYKIIRGLLIITFIFISTPDFIIAGTPELLFEAGSKAYLEGDWRTALEHWEQIEASGYHSSALYYNMGNAYFKTGILGKSILYWEKAAKLIGEDSDLAANLEIARARLVDKIDEPVRLPVWDWFDWIRTRFSATVLGYVGIIICFIIFAVMALRKWVARNPSTKRRLLIPVWIIIVLLVFDLSLLALKARDDLRQREGILLVSDAEVFSAPAHGSGKLLFSLHEGTKVRIYRELKDWYEISAGKDRQGWIKKKALGVI